MRRHQMPDMKEGNVNVTPLIDIVMCLIIFFMLVARIGVDTGADASIRIPSSVMGIDIKDLGNTVTLNISETAAHKDEPEVSLLHPKTGQKVTVGITDTAPSGELVRPLEDLLTAWRKNLGPECKVIIRADQDLNYRLLEPVLITCAKAKVKDVNFATRRGEAVVAQQ